MGPIIRSLWAQACCISTVFYRRVLFIWDGDSEGYSDGVDYEVLCRTVWECAGDEYRWGVGRYLVTGSERDGNCGVCFCCCWGADFGVSVVSLSDLAENRNWSQLLTEKTDQLQEER